MNEAIQELIERLLFDEYEVDEDKSDLDHIYFKDIKQFIRIWSINEKGILYSIFEPGYDSAEEIDSGYCMICHSDDI